MATDQEKLNFYLPRDEAQAFRQVAKEQNRTITAILRRAVQREIAEHEAQAHPA